MDEDEIQDMLGENMKFNIIFTVGQQEEEEEEDEETSEDETSEEEENIKMSKEEYKLHKKEEAKNQKNKYFKKNQKIKMKKKDWDKWYQGVILEVKEVKPNPLYNTYDIELYGDEWKTQENIKGKIY